MIIGIPKEAQGQPMVAATPETAAKLAKLGYDVAVERGAGERAHFPDAGYEAKGSRVVDADAAWGADVVLHLDMPCEGDLNRMRPGAVLVCRMDPYGNPQVADQLAQRGITGLAMDAIPRLSRAQSMDVRSSMMNIAGYKAVIEAADTFGRTFSGQVTAAGKTRPASVYVIGVGVAGLAAIGQAVSLGAQVYATDVRSDVAQQVESLGATFVEIPVKQESADGYARALTDDEQRQVLQVYAEQAAKSDVVITTAQVPGRAAPLLLTAEAVAGMRPGSVVVDMGASPLGGNCAVSLPDETVVTENGVTVLGPTDLPSLMPAQASMFYGQNIVNFLKLATPAKDGSLALDQGDDIVRGVTVALDGQVTWPPPQISVSAAPAKQAAPAGAAQQGGAQRGPAKGSSSGFWWKALLGIAFGALVFLAPSDMAVHFMVFALACVVGFYVITDVSHSLHTPLMSETNAISGIIIVGAVLQLAASGSPAVTAVAFAAMALSAINIFGGFSVTKRMLKMFERSAE